MLRSEFGGDIEGGIAKAVKQGSLLGRAELSPDCNHEEEEQAEPGEMRHGELAGASVWEVV